MVVDAGHGRQDSGAVGPSGTLEKTVALATAWEFGRQFRATGRYRVAFTREADLFVPLAARAQLADAVRLPAHRGSSRAIARPLSDGPPAPSMLGSARLQLAMVASLDDLAMVPDSARQGRFRVLSALSIPSMLVETGFITNRQDEALLRQPRYQARIAPANREAVDEFFTGRDPQQQARRT